MSVLPPSLAWRVSVVSGGEASVVSPDEVSFKGLRKHVINKPAVNRRINRPDVSNFLKAFPLNIAPEKYPFHIKISGKG